MQRVVVRRLALLAALQGAYFALTGAWALVHIESFMLVTGPKTDVWLVKTVGILVLAIGIALLVAAARERVSLEVAILAIGTAAGLAAIDIVYATTDVIRDVYLLDAAAEALLILAWGAALWRERGDLALWGPIRPSERPGAGRRRRPRNG